jgi:hypothetical protein
MVNIQRTASVNAGAIGRQSVSVMRQYRMLSMAAFLIGTILLWTSAASAQVPTKNVKIYNNSASETIYPVIAAYVGAVDLWLQAQFRAQVQNTFTQTFCNNDPFNTSCANQSGVPRLYRAFINPNQGILPGQFVSINVPFYTQLTVTTPQTIGTTSGQYIDWWNAQRIFLYDGATALSAARNYNVDQTGKIVPPTPVTPLAGAVAPSCAADNQYNCEPVPLSYYIGVYPTGSVPFQLVEYTFGAAEGPPPGGLLPSGSPLSIRTGIINFNISAVDGIYLPVAMQAVVFPGDPNFIVDSQYLGTVSTVRSFRRALNNFISNGNGPAAAQWPYYFPSYFSAAQPTIPYPTPQDGNPPYPLPAVPSANTVLAESYRNPAPAPPVLSSDTNGTPMLGSVAQGMVNLWTTCTTTADNSPTCQQIRNVFAFFSSNYTDTCGLGTQLPDTPTMMTQVYGWAEFPQCPAGVALVDTPGYTAAIADFCSLQYNYLVNIRPSYVFNPYAQLVHGRLNSNAYAFSVDDKAAFKSVPSNQLIVTIGGAKGLVNNRQAPLPNPKTYATYCH